MRKLNHKGFAVIEGLLIFVILGIIGGVGYYTYHANQNTPVAVNTQPSKIIKHKGATINDPTAEWTKFTSAEGKFSAKYPSSWVQADTGPKYKELCSDYIYKNLFVAPDSDSVLKCGTDGGFGEVSIISWAKKDYLPDPNFNSGYKSVVKKQITIDGVTGTRTSAVASGQSQLLGSLEDGSIVVQYVFEANGNVYQATYYQRPTYKDVLSTFDTIVTKTLKFE